jgi:hypothetical protein
VSHIWLSYATCLFIEFGHLTPGGTYSNLQGNVRECQPKGEWSITSMHSWPAWKLRQNGRVIASWTQYGPPRLRALRLLIGRRLKSLEIDPASKSTRLAFSLGLELETKTDIHRLRREPHWLMRGPQHGSDNWPHIALGPWSQAPRDSLAE